ncbi:MAG: acetolactate decarboxylase [Solirubrobacterales bacterium]
MPSVDPELAHAVGLRVVDHDHLAKGDQAHTAVQTSTIAALLDGAYDGEVTIGELLEAGDLGLGTLDALDGELVILDGEAWQCAADGSVNPVAPGTTTPFAVVTRFAADESLEAPGPLAHGQLMALLEEHAPPATGCDAIRIDGRFSRVHARSVPRQDPPYPSLAEVAEGQVEWTFEDVEGTVVGFRFPRSAAGVEVTGHHLHFLASDRSCGGHVLECDLEHGMIQVEEVDGLRLELPPGVELPSAGDADEEAVRRIESG